MLEGLLGVHYSNHISVVKQRPAFPYLDKITQ